MTRRCGRLVCCMRGDLSLKKWDRWRRGICHKRGGPSLGKPTSYGAKMHFDETKAGVGAVERLVGRRERDGEWAKMGKRDRQERD
jgi:hypothetical protein